ncbi:MAG: nitroreductase [Hyphomicrobiales bacterium]|nr:MAG: nitroreductase [Hyphomicrobiales bacterium]
MIDKTAVTDHPIEPALAGRWSPRAFAAEMIDDTTTASLFEAARWSPSANNLQPWAFIHGARGKQDFDRLLGCLNDSNASWAGNAALLVIGIARSTKADGSVNAYARYDLGQAVAHLTFQATALGLHLHQMAGFDREKTRAELGIPAEYEPVSAIAIGYLGDPSNLPQPLRDRELATRTRNPTSTFVFPGRWPG